jgi:hypothetical protein
LTPFGVLAISETSRYNLSKKSIKSIGIMTIQNVSQSATSNQPALPINPDLIWDYDIPAEAQQGEAFRRWYITRVLTRGRATDIKSIGFDTIYNYLPTLNLPTQIRHFWEWYFSLPEVEQRYGDTYLTTTSDVDSNRPNSPGA